MSFGNPGVSDRAPHYKVMKKILRLSVIEHVLGESHLSRIPSLLKTDAHLTAQFFKMADRQ